MKPYIDCPGQPRFPGRAMNYLLHNLPGFITYPFRALWWYGWTVERNKTLEYLCDEVTGRIGAYHDKLDEQWGLRTGAYSPDAVDLVDQKFSNEAS